MAYEENFNSWTDSDNDTDTDTDIDEETKTEDPEIDITEPGDDSEELVDEVIE